MKTILILGVAGALAGACAPTSPRELRTRGAPAAHYSPATYSPAGQNPPDCGKTNIAGDEYGTEIRPSSGPPGTEVAFSGTTLRGEDWEWAPSDRLEAWWNTDVPSSESSNEIEPGPVVRLARVDDMERCRFETTFTIPDVEPGRYKISVFSWFADPNEGYGLFLPHHFTVNSAPSECPQAGENGSGSPPVLPLALTFKESGAWDSATFHAAYAPLFRVTQTSRTKPAPTRCV